MVIVAAGSVAVAVSAGQVGLRATGVGEWAAPTCEGRWGNGDVVVAIALHKFGLEEKRKEKKKNLSCCCQLKRVACVHAKSAQQERLW